MAEKLGEALLDLDTNDKGFRKGVDDAEKRARGLGGTLDLTSERALKLGRSLAIGAAAGAAAFGAAVVKASRDVAEMAAQAKMAGVNVEDFQRLKYAAEQNQVGVDALADGLKELNLRADEFIVTGQGSAAEAFYRLGYRADELKTKLSDPAALFTEIIARLGQLDTAAQIRISDELFGGSGGEQFIRLLDGGAEGIKRLGDEAERLGLVVGTENVAAMVQFDATMKRVGNVVNGFMTQLAVGATPELDRLARKLSDPQFVTGSQQMAGAIVGAVNQIIEAVSAGIGWLGQLQRTITWMGSHDMFGNPIKEDPNSDASRLAMYRAMWSTRDDINSGNMSAPSDDFYRGIFADPTATSPTIPPGLSGLGFTSGLGQEQVDKAKELIASLRDELGILRETDPVQQRLLGMRENLAKATDAQRLEAENLIRTIYEETRAWESAQQAGQFFGDQLLSSIEALRTGSKSLTEVLNDVVNALAQAVLQSMLLGQGPLAGIFGTASPGGGLGGMLGGLFSGFFAKGGLIPNGTFGIVGERGPEPVIGTSAGARVLPNSTLTDMMGGGGASGPLQIVIQGSGLSQAELSQAISDAIEQFDRFKLPQRVAEINSDPLARG
ncbi:hypothetical protein [Devosia sp.]|uniref:hypothetical protein n=1 Tax=Devosia sp. TaxID=1871048 RepID=UPI001AD1B8CA|nr:hypothetical protein [Devosia sp.]MBN9333857.1 hypothetical protein [Devosia sp.]